MSTVVAVRRVYRRRPPGRAFCSPPPRGCGREKDLSEFYFQPSSRTGRPEPMARCKECAKAAATADRLIRRGRAMWSSTKLDTEVRVLVVFPVEPMFVLAHEPEPEATRFPMYGVSPECPRGNHAWQIETVCRGYEALGCEGAGPHVHKRCVTHSCEEIEMAPTGLRRRT